MFAEKYRPKTIEEMVGQEHIIGKGKILNTLLELKSIPNMVLYGTPGTGKTTFAEIAAQVTNQPFIFLNAVNLSVKEIRDAITKNKNGLILYIDEFHMLNKKQQQEVLGAIERGKVTLIVSTSENPYHAIHNAVISRCSVFEFRPLSSEDIKKSIINVAERIKEESLISTTIELDALNELANIANGDTRTALNTFELVYNFVLSDGCAHISLEDIKNCGLSKVQRWDRDGDNKYDTISAFHKSLRGSDPNAALHYLAVLIRGGDLSDICRRILCVASEDVGLANPSSVGIVKACVDSALFLGFPEARLPLSEAVIYLALQPKSNSAYIGIQEADNELDTKQISAIPPYLRESASYEEKKQYLFPHNYEGHWVEQRYLPSNIDKSKYYRPQENDIKF